MLFECLLGGRYTGNHAPLSFLLLTPSLQRRPLPEEAHLPRQLRVPALCLRRQTAPGVTAPAGGRMGEIGEEDRARGKEDGVGGQEMRDGIEGILKEGGYGIGLWMVTLVEERGRTWKGKWMLWKSCFACGCMQLYIRNTKVGNFLFTYSAAWKMVSYILNK